MALVGVVPAAAQPSLFGVEYQASYCIGMIDAERESLEGAPVNRNTESILPLRRQFIAEGERSGARYIAFLLSRRISLDPWDVMTSGFWKVRNQGYRERRACMNAIKNEPGGAVSAMKLSICGKGEVCRAPDNILPRPY